MKKIAFITGAGSGLGTALAQSLSNKNYHVCLAGRTEKKLKEAQKHIQGSSSIHVLDVRNKQEVSQVFKEVKTNFGCINMLVNNAGTGSFDLTENLDAENVHDMIDINLKGTIFCTQEVIPDMKTRNEGNIVQIVSTAGIEAKINETVYCASKFGVKGYTDSVRLEVEDTKIRINAFYMGGMNTDFWNGILDKDSTQHLMQPDDIATIIMNNIKQYPLTNVADVIIKNSK